MTRIDEIQVHQYKWLVDNFGYKTVHGGRCPPSIGRIAAKLDEEVDELHEELRRWAKDLTYSQDRVADEIGDVAIVLMGLASRQGLSFTECIELAWAKISARPPERVRREVGE